MCFFFVFFNSSVYCSTLKVKWNNRVVCGDEDVSRKQNPHVTPADEAAWHLVSANNYTVRQKKKKKAESSVNVLRTMLHSLAVHTNTSVHRWSLRSWNCCRGTVWYNVPTKCIAALLFHSRTLQRPLNIQWAEIMHHVIYIYFCFYIF